MITKEKLNHIYEATISGQKLTTNELISYGFTSNNLTELVKEKFLNRIRRGEYELEDLGSLYCYGDILVRKKRYESAKTCYLKYLEKDSEHIKSYYKLLNIAVLENKVDDVIKYYEIISNDAKLKENDKNLLLYLIHYSYELPMNYSYYAKYLSQDDIMISNDSDILMAEKQKELRAIIIKPNSRNDFKMAIAINKDLKEGAGWLEFHELIESLLTRALAVKNEFKSNYNSYINERKYNKLISLIENYALNHKLTIEQKYILKIAKDCEALLNGEKLTVSTNYTKNVFEAIDSRNYSLAFQLQRDFLYSLEKDGYREENVLLRMLGNINEIIKQVNANNKEETNDLSFNVYQELITGVKVNIYSDLIGNLKEKDYFAANLSLHKILREAKKDEYIPIIKNLIEISILENDSYYSKVVVALTLIMNDNLEFDVAMYLNEFYLAIKEKDTRKAEAYFEILNTGEPYSKIINSEMLVGMRQKISDISITMAPINEDVYNTDIDFGLEKINYINYLAKKTIMESYDVEQVIHDLKLNDDEGSILYLLCAKEYYELTQVEMANVLVRKALEYSSNITTVLLAKQLLLMYNIPSEEMKLILKKKDSDE